MSDPEAIQADLQLMLSGHFSPASVGPDVYEATLQRVRSQSNDVLDHFEEVFLGVRFDAKAQSNLYLAGFLKQLQDSSPDRVNDIAKNLLRQYDAVLVIFDQVDDKSMLDSMLPGETADFLLRLNDRREALQRLIAED